MAASSMAQRASKTLREAARAFLDALPEEQARRVVGRRTVIPRRPKGRRLTASNTWEKWEIALLGKAPDEEVARQIGRNEAAVAAKRRSLGIPKKLPEYWTPDKIALLGAMSDSDVARQIGRNPVTVAAKRRSLGIAPKLPPHSGPPTRSPCSIR